MRRVLKKEGFDVTTAANGAEALVEFQKASNPIIFTDIYMPEMTGIELLEKVKQHHSDTQVIIMTDYASTESAISTLRAGAYDYIMKPFEDINVISNTAHRAAQEVRLYQENRRLVEMLKRKTESLEAANANLKELATHDALTRLCNHHFFLKSLLAEIHRSERYDKVFSLLFIDLDNFKIYNDANGHLQGDQLLRSISLIFLESFRKTDIVARYGGDEFVVILPETSNQQAQMLAAKLYSRVIAHPFPGIRAMPGTRISVSIGSATFPQDGAIADELIQCADKAMYAAKKKQHLLGEIFA